MPQYYKAQVILGDDGFPVSNNKPHPEYGAFADVAAVAVLPTKQVTVTGNELHVYGIEQFGKKEQNAFRLAQKHGVKCFKPRLIHKDWGEDILMLIKANDDEGLRKAVALAFLYHEVPHEVTNYLRSDVSMYTGPLLGYDPNDAFAFLFGIQLKDMLYKKWYNIPPQELATLKRQLAQTASVAKQYFDKAFVLAQQELERFLKSKKVKDAVKRIRPHIVDF